MSDGPKKRGPMSATYYARNRESILAKEKARYELNGDSKREAAKQYGRTHREQSRQRNKAWKLANRERHLAQRKVYWHKNRARLLEEGRNRHHANRGENNRKRMDYHRKHPEVLLQASSKRRALMRKCQVNLAGIKIWMKEVRGKPFARCHWCGTKVSGSNIHFDHVTPISKGGSHTIGNLCSACQECNSSKHDRLMTEWPRNGQTFLQL